MKNFKGEGHMMEYQNGGTARVSGEVIEFAFGIGVASADIAANAKGSVAMCGVFKLAKEAALAITQGDILYWNTTSNYLTKTNTDLKVGYAWSSAAGADTQAEVKLHPGIA